MAQVLNVGETITLEAAARTASGQRGKFTTPPMWLSSPPGLLSLTPSPDGLTCHVIAEVAGDVELTVSCPGLTPATFLISVLPEAATSIVVRVVKT